MLTLLKQLLLHPQRATKGAEIFLLLFVFTFPLQVRSLLYAPGIFLTGHFNPFASFFVYLPDLFLLLAFLFWGLAFQQGTIKVMRWGDRNFTLLLAVFLGFIVLSLVVAGDRSLSFFLMLRFVEWFLLYLLLLQDFIRMVLVAKVFLFALGFQAILALGQFFLQHSIGWLSFLGEPLLSATTVGVAKIDLLSGKIVRPYGTFPHPNVLAGALGMAGVLFCALWPLLKKKYTKLWLTLLGLIFLAFLLTFSRSAFVGLVAGGTIFLLRKKIPKFTFLLYILGFIIVLFSALFVFKVNNLFFTRLGGIFNDAATQERMEYVGISWNMLTHAPLGVGIGNFTLQMQDFTSHKLTPWLFQPVHNVFLLVANELGLLGGVVFLGLCGYLVGMLWQQKQALALALVVGFLTVAIFDHYFFTLYQGQVLLFVMFAFVTKYQKT